MVAKQAKVSDNSFLQHIQTCSRHGRRESNICWGHLKNGANCSNKGSPHSEDLLPICGTHQSQRRMRGECKAILNCGFACSRLYEWIPFRFGLCPDHENLPNRPCFLLQIPTEIRLRIYSFLLPDKPVPARYWKSHDLRSDLSPASCSILAVNHQIHSEGIDLMYRKATFCIEISNTGIVMLNTAHKPAEIPPSRPLRPDYRRPSSGTFYCSVQDYQLQMRLLELQNKKRLAMARVESDLIFCSPPQRSPPPMKTTSLALVPDLLAGEYGPVWNPSLSEPVFNLIRSFHVKIEANLPLSVSKPGATMEPPICHNVYEMTDQLQQLVARLELVKPCINNLRFTIVLQGSEDSKEALAAVPLLLRPFNRLRNVVRPSVESISWLSSSAKIPIIELLAPTQADRTEDMLLSSFLDKWKADISSSSPKPEAPITTQAYWLLQATIVDILHYRVLNDDFDFYYDHDLRSARIARESDDVFAIHEIWENVIRKWKEYSEGLISSDNHVYSSISLLKSIMVKGFEQAVITPNDDERVGKGKEKIEDNNIQGEVFSWVSYDEI
jgi:hypothetical protein